MKKIISIFCLALFIFTSCQQVKQKVFEQAIQEINKQCPMTIDEVTRLDSTSYTSADNSLHYFYTLTGYADDPAIADATKQELEKTLPEYIKSNKDMELYKQSDVTIIYVYLSEKTKQELFRIKVTSDMYK